MLRGKIKWICIVVILIVVTIIMMLGLPNQSKNVLILDALMNGTLMEYVTSNKEEQVTPPTDLINGEYSVYHRMASDIDTSKIDEMLKDTSIQVPEEYYNLSKLGKIDYIGEIEVYKLICEILTRPEINPEESNFKITPANIYGSWYNESGMLPLGADLPLNPYKSLIQITTSSMYRGPLQFNVKYTENEPSGVNDLRMYVYLAQVENQEIDDNSRVLRIKPKELNGLIPDFKTITGITYNRTEEDIKSIAEGIYSSTKYSGITRPNIGYLSDVFYTFSRKLRTASNGTDIYTFNPNYTTSLDNLNTFCEDNGISNSMRADLIYMYTVQLNSGNIPQHQWSEDGAESNGKGLMPAIYIAMIDKYGTLDMSQTGLFDGWSEQSELVNSITGKRKGQGHLKNQKIVNDNNMISNVGMREVFDGAVNNIELTEYSYTTTYGLECIANGNMIQRGVEYAIQQIYDWQEDKGYLISQTGESSEVSNNTTIIKMFGIDVATSIPWSFDKPVNGIVYHDYYCNNQFCSYHPNNTHYGVDYIFYTVEDKKRVSPNINAYLGGMVRKVTTVGSGSPYGNSVTLIHDINGKVYYTVYAHMSEVYLTSEDVGKTVLVGQKIGVEGATGRVTGRHLHFELGTVGMYNSKKPTNPEKLIQETLKG